MTRIIRLLSITATAALALITTSLFGQGAGRAPDLSSAPAVQAKVVTSTVTPPPVPQPAPRAGAPEVKVDPATGYRKRKIAEISSKVQESLSIGPPDGLNQFMTKLRAKKKSKIDRTKLVNRILADGIAARQFAKNDPQSLSTESLNAALDGITEEDVATFIRERFERLTGLKVPEDKQRLLEHIKKQNAQAKQVLSQAPEVIALAPVRVPTKDMPAFNWTLPGFAAKSTGIVTAVQNQDPDRDCSPGSCWAFATVGAFEAAYAKANGVLIGASEQYLLNCAGPVLSQSSDPILRAQPWSCEGGWWAFPMLVPSDVQNAGLPLRVQLPFTGSSGPCPASMDKPYQAKTWGYVTDGFSIPPDDVLKGALCEHGPLVVALLGDQAWILNAGAVIHDQPNDATDPSVNHAVVLVGWDDSKGAWIIKNSWGTGYGIQESGFLYIAYQHQNLGYSAAYVVAAPGN